MRWSCPAAGTDSPYPTTSPALAFWSIPQRATALNPGNLPVGFARHEDAESGRAYLDVTCAAYHTGALRFGGQAIRIDGGAALPLERAPACFAL